MMRWKFGIVVLLLLWQSIPVAAQVFSVHVVDTENGTFIPFATGRWNHSNEIFFSDVNGVFLVKEHVLELADTLFITHLGFEPTFVTGFDRGKRKVFNVKMNPFSVELEGATILENSPLTMIKKVKSKLKNSIPKRSVVQPSFYRQIHIEDNRGVFFLESMTSVNFGKGMNKQLKVKVEKLRRIPSSERNKEQHSDHLMDLLYANPLYNEVGGPLHAQVYSDFRWSFGSLPADSSEFTKLNFVEIMEDKINKRIGTLIIRNSDYAILKYITYFARTGDCDLNMTGSSEKFIWLKMEETCVYDFEWVLDSVYLKSAQQEYTHFLVSKIFQTVDHELKEYFYWKAMGPFSDYTDSLPSYKLASNLYSQEVRSDRLKWSGDRIQDFFPVQPQVLLFFGGLLKLEENFLKMD